MALVCDPVVLLNRRDDLRIGQLVRGLDFHNTSRQRLFRDAARNHQLERTYEAERRAARTRRRDADCERRAAIAEAFLTDSTQRALVHPTPTPKRCYVATKTGRALFDISTDVGLARELPPEAHRRFRADLRVRRENNLSTRAEQLALHEEKKRVIADWIAAHGTPEQQTRQAAGVLPMDEAVEAITDQAFVALSDQPVYVHDGIERMQRHLQRSPEYANTVVTRGDLLVTSANVDRMTAAEFALVQQAKQLMPTRPSYSASISWRGSVTYGSYSRRYTVSSSPSA